MPTLIRTLVQSQSDLQDIWKVLMGPGEFGGHSIWMHTHKRQPKLIAMLHRMPPAE